jgi:hypothetical protein
MVRIRCLTMLMLCVFVGGNVYAAEAEFRCDTEVFVGTEKQPAQETLTIFTGNLAYDFLLTKPEEITVYDFGRGQLTLLDKGRKVRTTIPTDNLLRFSAAYKTAKAESDLFAFCTQPSFEESFADDVLMLEARPLSYKATCCKPEVAGADKRYREFADWSTRLNALRPGNLPPFPRMEMNKALAARGMLPSEVERTIVATSFTMKRTDVVRSYHLYNWALSAPDRRKIDTVGEYLTQFQSVPVEEYLQLEKATGK